MSAVIKVAFTSKSTQTQLTLGIHVYTDGNEQHFRRSFKSILIPSFSMEMLQKPDDNDVTVHALIML